MQTFSDKKMIAFVAIIFALTVGLVGLILFYKNQSSSANNSKNRTEMRQVTNQQPEVKFPKMEEKSTTPKEVNNQVIDELDTLVKDVDTNNQDNLNDLSL